MVLRLSRAYLSLGYALARRTSTERQSVNYAGSNRQSRARWFGNSNVASADTGMDGASDTADEIRNSIWTYIR